MVQWHNLFDRTIKDAWSHLVNGASGAFNSAKSWFTNTFVSKPSELLGDAVSSGIQPVIEGLDNSMAPVVDLANDPQSFVDPSTGAAISDQIASGSSSAGQIADNNLGFMNQLVGSLSGENQRILQELQKEAAKAQYDFTERMSSTAYQRAVSDMRKAGLNPAVMFAGGQGSSASTPQAGIASVATENQLLSNLSSAAQLLSALGSILKGVGEIIPL